MMTGEQYEASLRKLNLVVYLFGTRVRTRRRPGDPAVVERREVTYDLATTRAPGLMCAVSHLTARASTVHPRPPEPRRPVKKSLMGRCSGRSPAAASSAVSAWTPWPRCRSSAGPRPGARHRLPRPLREYLAYVQERDLVCDGAMTDPRRPLAAARASRPRPLPPRRRGAPDGIVVRAQGAPDRRRELPRGHRHADHGHARRRRGLRLAFAVPSDTPGITYISAARPRTPPLEATPGTAATCASAATRRSSCSTTSSSPGSGVHVREVEFAGRLSSSSLVPPAELRLQGGVGDVLIGHRVHGGVERAAKASHVRDKIVEMCHLNETLFCGASPAGAGHCEPCAPGRSTPCSANVHKQNVTRFPYEIARWPGRRRRLIVTLPSERTSSRPRSGRSWRSTTGRRGVRRSTAPHAPPRREPHARLGRRRLPHRVDARRRSPSPAHHDRPPGRPRARKRLARASAHRRRLTGAETSRAPADCFFERETSLRGGRRPTTQCGASRILGPP